MILATANQKDHTRLTLTTVQVTDSTTSGLNLFDYFQTKMGRLPTPRETVRFVVNPGVDIIAATVAQPAVREGAGWSSANTLVIENHGRILGRGGSGGRSAYPTGTLVRPIMEVLSQDIVPAQGGEHGGTAIKSSTVPIKVYNHSIIAGGGGGGGGMGLWSVNNRGTYTQTYVTTTTIGGAGGSGGGAPLGKRSPNGGTWQSYLTYYDSPGVPFSFSDLSKVYFWVSFHTGFAMLQSFQQMNEKVVFTTPSNKTGHISVPLRIVNGKLENILDKDWDGEYIVNLPLVNTGKSHTLQMSKNATTDTPGIGGYAGGFTIGNEFVGRQITNIDLPTNHGGAGGGIGEPGLPGVINNIYRIGTATTVDVITRAQTLFYFDNAPGGFAGYVKEGNVTINNLPGSSTKGR